MTEATAEEAPSDAEVQEAERQHEKTAEEADVEASPADRKNYEPQASERKYARRTEYKKASKNADSKPSANSSGGLEKVLAKALADSEAIGSEHGVDPAEVFSSILARHLISRGDSANKLDSDEEEKIKDSYDTPSGAGYIIWTKNPKTGVVYVSTEIKTASYRYVEARGKLALHGETSRVGENNPLETAVRGLMEENPKSYTVLLNALRENGGVYDRVKSYIDGVPSETTFIQIQVPWELWDKYVSDKNPEAPKVIMSLDEIFTTKRSDWAFNNYDILMGFIEKNWDRFTQVQHSKEKRNNFVPFTYSDSIMPKYSNLSTQILNSSGNQQYKTQFQISNGIYNPN